MTQQTPRPVGPIEYASVVPIQRTDGVSVAAMVTGLVGLIIPVLPAVAAIVLAAIGLKRTAVPGVGGRGYAVAGLVLGLVGLVLLPVLAVLLLSVRAVSVPGPAFLTRAYYTVDDGQTFFSDRIDRIPPFDHNGQQAVRAHVFSCDGGQTRFGAFLERYTPEAAEKIEQARQADPMGFDYDAFYLNIESSIEYRLPGPTGRWVNIATDSQAAAEVTSVRCPDGSVNNLRPVLP